MSWLYDHRHQLDGLQPLVEIAHWVTIFRVPPEDQDDVEQEIVIELIQTVEKYGNKGKAYLRKVAINRRNDYFNRKYKEKRLCYIEDTGGGEWAGGAFLVSHDRDSVAHLDAIATLATLSERLIQIGHKILDGEKLSGADQAYRIRQKARLRPKLKYANHISDWEGRRILQRYREDMCVHKIAITMGRDDRTILRVLASHEPRFRQNWLAKKEMEAKERDERIRHAYFVDGKGISRIVREFGYSNETVYKAIRAATP
ncbi:hypothetical protein ES705_16674 [subsurface metagenome]